MDKKNILIGILTTGLLIIGLLYLAPVDQVEKKAQRSLPYLSDLVAMQAPIILAKECSNSKISKFKFRASQKAEEDISFVVFLDNQRLDSMDYSYTKKPNRSFGILSVKLPDFATIQKEEAQLIVEYYLKSDLISTITEQIIYAEPNASFSITDFDTGKFWPLFSCGKFQGFENGQQLKGLPEVGAYDIFYSGTIDIKKTPTHYDISIKGTDGYFQSQESSQERIDFPEIPLQTLEVPLALRLVPGVYEIGPIGFYDFDEEYLTKRPVFRTDFMGLAYERNVKVEGCAVVETSANCLQIPRGLSFSMGHYAGF